MDNFFKDLLETGERNTSDDLQKDCLWLCFAELLQEDLNAVIEHWNTHPIRKSRMTLLLVFQIYCIIYRKEQEESDGLASCCR